MNKKQKENHFKISLLTSAVIFLSLSLLIGKQIVDSKKSTPSETTVHTACSAYDLSGRIDTSQTVGVFEQNEIEIPQLAFDTSAPKTNVLGLESEERWIEVDLSDQRLYAWEGNTLYLETPVSTGLPWWPTPEGEFRIWIKLRATRMEGGEGAYYYNLPNVPYVMFFENEKVPGYKGYGLHGAYWHNEFGTPRSHGCVNLPTDVAKTIYEWTEPVLTTGKTVQKVSETNNGTRIVIHK